MSHFSSDFWSVAVCMKVSLLNYGESEYPIIPTVTYRQIYYCTPVSYILSQASLVNLSKGGNTYRQKKTGGTQSQYITQPGKNEIRSLKRLEDRQLSTYNRERCVCRVLRIARWMRSSLYMYIVRASDCQCRSRNSPGFDPRILRHRRI